MKYDIIFVTGEAFVDSPLCGTAILKRLLEDKGYKIGIIEMPQKEEDIKQLGKPNLFFAVSSGSIDSMVRNYTPLKKPRIDDKNLNYNESVPDRAVIVYSNWIKKIFKDSIIVLGGIEASLRRFVHYDFWDNKLRKPILLDSRADILVYGCGEKQVLQIANSIKKGNSLENIHGTCTITKEIPNGFEILPSYDELISSKERFCDMQNMLSNMENLVQKIDNRYVVQNKSPVYTTKDLDYYYELPFTRKTDNKNMEGFKFSVVTHRGCIGECNFCSINLTQGNRIISRSEESILREIRGITKMPHFEGNIDDLGGPSANMYGMDCNIANNNNNNKCMKSCIECPRLDRSNKKLISLLRKARNVKGVKNVFVRSGIRYDLASSEYIKELSLNHISGKLKIAPEHVNEKVLGFMNKNRGDLKIFIKEFNSTGTKNSLSFYFMTAHPGSGIKEAEELANAIKSLKNAESVQIFTPTPMTVSTCMYFTGLDPKTQKKIHVPYTYLEKKKQKRIIFEKMNSSNNISLGKSAIPPMN